MSLFGTGRREGVQAALTAGLLVATVHTGAAWRLDELDPATWTTAAAGGCGALLTYRFLRAQGRSRYAAFLCAAAYGMSPLFAGLHGAPREQIAAALAPLGLEAVAHLENPAARRRWLPWFGVCLALPALAGVTVIGALAAALGLCMLAITTMRSGSGEARMPRTATALGLVGGGAAAANLAAVDLLAPWLGGPRTPAIADVLAGEATPMVVVRVVGPFLVWFALLGLLRRQRHVSATLWILLALVGAAPTALLAFPDVTASFADALTAWSVPAVAWWLSVLAVTVMGAAGLDDWLDQPLRRRGAHLLLLSTTLFVAPALPLAGAQIDPLHLCTVLGTFAALAAVTLTWRRLGVLRFKFVLTMTGLAAFAVPVVWRGPAAVDRAAPLADVARPSLQRVWEHAASLGWVDLYGVLTATGLALVAWVTLRSTRS